MYTQKSNRKLSWSAPEYEEKNRSRDWFWALGIIIFTSVVASLIYGNYFFAILLLLSGFMLGFFAIKKPDMVYYELSANGLRVGNSLFPYKNIKAFWVQNNEVPTLFIKADRLMLPVISIPIDLEHALEIHETFVSNEIPEEEMKEPPSKHIMDALGF